MSLTDQLLAWLAFYGVPVLFAAVAVSSLGLPLPATLMLIVAGSFVQQGEMSQVRVVAASVIAGVLGDMAGYMVGRWGGRRLAERLLRPWKGAERLREAERRAG